MARILLIGILAAIIFWVVSIVDCAVQPPTRHQGVSKPTWMVIVILLPVIGGILWFVLGRRRAGGVAVIATAPDDDLVFLNSLGMSAAAVAEQDERIRLLEEELAKLDAEDAKPEDPTDPSRNDDDDSRDQHGARG